MKFKESETIEFKKSTSEIKEAVVAIASILNKQGKGELYFGIKDDGMVCGQEIGKKTIGDVSQAISEHIEPRIFPHIKIKVINGKSCIYVKFSGRERPYFAYGRVYMRVGDQSKQLTMKELEAMILTKHVTPKIPFNNDKIRWESQLSKKKLAELNVKIVREYVAEANRAKRINFKFSNTKVILHKLGLLDKRRPLKAAEVLFCEQNHLEVQAAVFAGVDRITFLDIQQFKGNIFSLLEKSENYLKEHMNWRVEIKKIERDEIPEIPLTALREALVNSFCHRDYIANESNKIGIFKDRIEVWNPGSFPKGLTPEDFIKHDGQSVLRNPLIADILYKSGDIEKWGSGLKKIYNDCKRQKVRVEFKVLKTGFMVVFFRSTPQVTPQATPQAGLTDLETKIIKEISNNPKVSRNEIAKALDLSPDTVKEYIDKLKQKGVLQRVGKTSSGYWLVSA